MQIVHVVRQFHPAIGGLENVVSELANAQLTSGHDVRVVTLNRVFNSPQTGRLPSNDHIAGLEIVRIPFFGSKRYPIAFSAIRYIKDADIVHVHGIDFFFDYLAWTVPLHRRKLVVSTHGGFFHTPFAAWIKRPYFHILTRLSLSWYAGVAAVSVADYALFKKIRTRGITLIENGANISKYRDASAPVPKKTLLSIGRLSSNKGLDRLIYFLAALRRFDSQWTLCIAGRPWDLPVSDLVVVAKKIGMEGYVRILATPSDATIRKVMADCSVLVSASAYEGFGLVAVEGLSAGLWPVLSAIPAFQNLIEKCGLGTILDFSNANSAAQTFLTQWPNIAANYNSHRQIAMTRAGRFAWSAVSKKYEALYDSALGTQVRSILEVPVQVKTSSEAVELLDASFDRGDPRIVIFANAHTLNAIVSDPQAGSTVSHALVFNDGIGMDIASWLLFRKPFPENLNGTDFVPHYLQRTKNSYRIFLLGAKSGVAKQTADRLAKVAQRHKIVGWEHGYTAPERAADVISQIRRSRADILLVAMGDPAQELWLNAHLKETGCRLGFGVGGLFDFVAGVVPRAPRWVRVARIEWAYRMLQEPRRLWRRYLLEMPVFLLRVSQQWLTGARVSSAAHK